jgi:hypothetical protein
VTRTHERAREPEIVIEFRHDMQTQTSNQPVTEVFHAEPDFAVGRCGPVFIVVWKVDTTEAGMKRVAELFRAAKLPDRVGMLTVVDQAANMPSAEARALGAAFLSRNATRIVASAVVHEGSGFRAAAVRAVVTGLSMIARQPYPHKVFPEVQPAASWLCQAGVSGHGLSAPALVRHSMAVRSA